MAKRTKSALKANRQNIKRRASNREMRSKLRSALKAIRASLDANDVANGPIYTVDEVFEDPQVKHLGIPKTIDHPAMGPSRLIGSAVNLSDTPPQFLRPAPLLGEHTDEILTRFCYDKETIERLRASGVI